MVGAQAATARKRTAAWYFRDQIYPRFRRLEELLYRSELYGLALDRALYTDESERLVWIETRKALDKAYETLESSSEYQSLLAGWRTVSQGLTGQLIDYDPKTWTSLEKTSSQSSSTRDKISEADTLYTDATQALSLITDPPAIPGEELLVKELAPRARRARAWVESQRMQFQKMAELRSQAAKDSGSPTWAHRQLKESAEALSSGLHRPETLARTLKKFLSDSKKLAARALANWSATYGKVETVEDLFRVVDTTPAFVAEAFSSEAHVSSWKRALTQAGVPDDFWDALTLDFEPRPGKHTHWYAMSTVDLRPHVLVLDARTLNFRFPARRSSYVQPRTTLLGQISGPGLGDRERVFHEGGHALDFFFRESFLGEVSSAPYDETLSTFWERHLYDPEHLREAAASAGRPLSEAEGTYLDAWVTFRDLIGFCDDVVMALSDLELWETDFSPASGPPPDFVETARAIYLKNLTDAFPLPIAPNTPLVDRSIFSTDHIVSGDVAYFEYPLASWSATVLWSHFSKQLRKASRKPPYRNPGLFPLLRDELLRSGFESRFPEGITAITGKTMRFESLRERFASLCDLRLRGGEAANQNDP